MTPCTLSRSTKEALPTLTPYVEEEDVTSGRDAAIRHWQGLSANDRAVFTGCLEPVLEYAALIQKRNSHLPNGPHDVAFSLPESRALYEPVLDRYGLNVATASSYDVATSLPTFDDASLQFALAEMLCRMPERERADYLRRFDEKADSRW